MRSDVINKRLPLIQDADLNNKVVLILFFHNVVKKVVLNDTFMIDWTIRTLYHIIDR